MEENKSYLNFEKTLTQILITISIIFLFLSILALKAMFKSYKKIKFENYVIISGIIQTLLILFDVILNYFTVLTIVDFMQFIISLFISRRFLRIYHKIRNSSEKNFKRFYALFFSLNFLLTTSILISNQLIINDNYSQIQISLYLTFAHKCFSLFFSFFLLIIGLKIKKLIYISNQLINNDHTSYLENTPNYNNNKDLEIELSPKVSTTLTEKSMRIRNNQINFVTFGFLSCDIVQACQSIFQILFYGSEVIFKDGVFLPTSMRGVFADFSGNLFNLVIVFCNYLAFYYFISNNFNRNKSSLLETHLSFSENKGDRFELNPEIQEYMKNI